jgi:hypothetical protein
MFVVPNPSMLYAYSMNFEAFAQALANDYRTDSYSVRDALNLYAVLSPLFTKTTDIPRHSDPQVSALVADAWDDQVLAESMKAHRKIEGIKRIKDRYTDNGPGTLKASKEAYEFIEQEKAIRALREKLLA